ncbi:MAG TPA: SDR family oxidoreductase [Myxococcus sp.]|nr:SDR family oxidoreductase [Myxococcus sp.]
MSSQVILVTGANSGIGKAAAEGLAAQGAHVVLLCRGAERGEQARADIMKRTGSKSVDLMTADLASQASIRQFAREFTQRYPRLDVLINNAGVNTSKQSYTEEGVDLIFGVNHLAHFLLTQQLLDTLRASGAGRIVNVASMWARETLDWEHLHHVREYDHLRAYGFSKLSNLLFTAELARRLQGTGLTVNACHPGAVRSNLGRDYKGFLGFGNAIAQYLIPKSARGAEVMVYLATSPDVEGKTGLYFGPKKVREPMPAFATDPANGARLWALSEELTAPGRPRPQHSPG